MRQRLSRRERLFAPPGSKGEHVPPCCDGNRWLTMDRVEMQNRKGRSISATNAMQMAEAARNETCELFPFNNFEQRVTNAAPPRD